MAEAERKEPSKRAQNAAKLPRLGGQLAAMWREGIKDIRQTMNEVFFSQSDHSPEAGAPFNPTQFMANDALQGGNYQDALKQHAARPKPDKDQSPSI